MLRRTFHLIWVVLALLALAVQPFSVPQVTAHGLAAVSSGFVTRDGPKLLLDGKTFRFAGANNYYLMYKSQYMVDSVLEAAAASGFTVMRIWGSLDIGNQDDSNSIRGKADGVYFQYWDGDSPAYNDGANGLEHLDYVVYKAGQLGLKLVIPLVNNWNDFGGMDQYVRWFGGQYHDQFFTEPVIRQWFKDWITHLLERTNTYTGIQYKDDPTIMTWELANEPRCLSAGVYPRSDSCTTQTLITWADEISTYIKSVDLNHFVSVGDEGFYCIAGASDWTENCNEGVDTLAFTALPNIDVMSFHLYPDHWGKSAAWGTQWIARHFKDARKLEKPAMLGEYGWQGKNTRNPVFKEWTDTVFNSKGNGALYWILSGLQDNGTYYPDYDGFTVYCPSPVCITLSNFGESMSTGKPKYFPPVADHDTALTEFETPVILVPAGNDIAYEKAVILPQTIDLDPAAGGQQTESTVYGGTYALQMDGTVLFTPATGFAGKSQVAYVIQDSNGQLSNPANLVVTVKPDPTGVLPLFSFETGTDGWAFAAWQANAGTTAQSPNFHTDGSFGLQVDSVNGGWFGIVTPLDLTGKTHFKLDLQTTNTGTSTNLVIQSGDSWTWCEAGWGWQNANTSATLDFDMTAMPCSVNLSKIQAVYIWFSGGGTYYLDYVRAE